MQKWKTSSIELRFLISILGVLCIILVGLSNWSSYAFLQRNHNPTFEKSIVDSDLKGLRMRNKTKAFFVVGAQIQGDSVQIEMRNGYDKPITAYQVLVGDTRIHRELLTNDNPRVISPGESVRELYPFYRKLESIGIIVLAVLFDNHTGDGDPEFLKRLLEYREGMKIQREHTIDALQKLINTSDISVRSALYGIMSDISAIPEEEASSLPLYVRFGLKDERERLLLVIQNLLDTFNPSILGETKAQVSEDTDYRYRLTTLITSYKQTINKL
jgi:hypothetical protein